MGNRVLDTEMQALLSMLCTKLLHFQPVPYDTKELTDIGNRKTRHSAHKQETRLNDAPTSPSG